MIDNIFLITIGGVIIAAIITNAFLKYSNQKKFINSPNPAKDVDSSQSNTYRGVERRARKRSTGGSISSA